VERPQRRAKGVDYEAEGAETIQHRAPGGGSDSRSPSKRHGRRTQQAGRGLGGANTKAGMEEREEIYTGPVGAQREGHFLGRNTASEGTRLSRIEVLKKSLRETITNKGEEGTSRSEPRPTTKPTKET